LPATARKITTSEERALMEWLVFTFFSVSISAIGIGMVLVASRIERQRRERHTERFALLSYMGHKNKPRAVYAPGASTGCRLNLQALVIRAARGVGG
jgi:hypothetical protein